jgi:hypothetical protein
MAKSEVRSQESEVSSLPRYYFRHDADDEHYKMLFWVTLILALLIIIGIVHGIIISLSSSGAQAAGLSHSQKGRQVSPPAIINERRIGNYL